MTTTRRAQTFVATATVLLIATSLSRAANFTWDSSGTNPASPVDGSGNWDTTSTLWSNGAADGLWTNDGSATAVFGFASGTGTAGTVTLATPINVAGIIFNSPHAGSYIIVDNGGGNTITLSGATPTISVNGAANSAAINTVLTGSTGLLFNGGGTLTLGAVNTYGGNTTLDGGTLKFGAGADMTMLTGSVVFGSAPGSTSVSTLDLTSASLNAGGLTVQTANASANTIKIGAGKTLVNSGAVIIGVGNQTTTTALSFTGGGTWQVNGGANNFIIAPESNTTANNVVVDMSNLANFAFTGTTDFRIAGSAGNGSGDRANATVTFANTSTTVTAGTFVVGGGSNSNNNTLATLHLGGGTNVINATTFQVSNQKSTGVLDFAGSTGSLKVRGTGGTDSDRSNITIGSRSASGSTAATGTVNLNGHSVDILAGTLLIGNNTNSNAGEAGTLNFDTGTIDATQLRMGVRTNGGVTGTLNISGTAHLIVGTSGIILTDSTSNAGLAKLSIAGGTVDNNGDLVEGTNTSGLSTLELKGGTLNMNSHNIGAAGAAAINTLTFQSGTLKNVNEINGGGAISVAPNATDTFTLDGTNSYTGSTTIAGGTLLLASQTAALQTSVIVTPNNGLKFAAGAGGAFTVGNLGGSGGFALADNAVSPQPITLSVGNNATSSQTYSGSMSGTGGALTVVGGTLTLGGNNTYTGNTTINAGTLVLNATGSLASAGAVKVNSGGTLAGTMGAGKSIGTTTLSTGGTIIAGISTTTPGTLNLSNLIVNGGTLQFNLGTTTTSSLINVLTGGSAAFSNPGLPGNSVPTISIPVSASALGTYTLLQSTAPISYPGGVPNFNTSFPTDAFTYHLNFTNPNSILLDVTGQIAHLLWTGGTGAGDQATWDNTTNASSQNWKNTDTNVNGVNYADPAIVTFGDLASSNVSISLNSSVTPNSVTVGGSNTSYTIQGSGSIGGALTALTKNGNATLGLLTANTYGGGTTINGGAVQINSASSLGASTGNATINAATLEVLGGNTISNSTRNFLLGSPNSTIQVDSGSTYSTSGTINDVSAGSPGTLNATGGGTLGLLGNNGYTGGTAISGGTIVQINSATSLGAASGLVKINAGTLEALNTISSTRNFQLGDVASTIQVDGAANIFTISGTLSNGAATGTLNKTGAGTLVLSGNNGFSGGTVIGSSLVAGGAVSISSDSPGLLNLGPVNAIVAGSQFNNNVVLTNGGTLATTATMALNSGRSIGLSGNGSLSVATGTTLTYAGTITDDNAVGNLNVAGGGTLYVTGTSNYTGTTTISGATAQLAAGTNRLPTGNTLNTTTTGVLVLGDVNGPANQSVTTLSSGGASAIPSIVGGNAAVSTLTVTYPGAAANYSRGIGGPGVNQNNVALVFSGTGTLRLNAAGGANADNTYTGGTTINSGTLVAAQTHGFGAVSGLVTLNGGTLGIEAGTTAATGISSYNVSIPDAANVNINPGRNSAGAAFTQTLGNLNIGAATLNVNAGTNVNSGTSSLAFGGATTLTSTANATTVLNPTSATLALGTVTGSATAGNTSTLQLDGTSSGNSAGAISDGLGGGKVALAKSNSSVWTLPGANTYTGNTTISGGTLLLGAANRILSGSKVTLSGGTLGTGGFSQSLATPLVLTTAGDIDLGAGASALHFAATDIAVLWGGNTLTVDNWSYGADHLSFGTSALGLGGSASNPINQINFTGHPAGARILSTGEVVPLPNSMQGDFNQDGAVTGADITVMLKALADVNAYQSSLGLLPSELATIGDFTGDGLLTNRDIQFELDLVASNGGGSVSSVPEPATLLLLIVGALAFPLFLGRRALRQRGAAMTG